MDAKAALKAAREAIRMKDYKEALKQCKSILKTDKTNFHAIVFVGVAAEGLELSDQALAAYRKAVDINPESPLGWQGLCGFYEKANNPDYNDDLVCAYQKLAVLLSSDPAKSLEVNEKLLEVLRNGDKMEEACELCLTLVEKASGKEKLNLQRQFITIADKLDFPSEEIFDKIKVTYEELTLHEADLDLWMAYMSWMETNVSCRSQLGNLAKRFSHAHPACIYPLELQARLLLDSFIGGDGVEADISCIAEAIIACDSTSGYSVLLQGVHAYSLRDWGTARENFTKGLSAVKSCVSAWYYLSVANLKMHKKHEAFVSASQGLQQLQKDVSYFGNTATIENLLSLLLAESCIEIGDEKHLKQAKDILDKTVVKDSLAEVCLLRIKLEMKNHNLQAAQEIISAYEGPESVDFLALSGWLYHLLGNDKKALESLNEALAKSQESSLAYYYMARFLATNKCKDQEMLKLCLTYLLKAAKMDPFSSDIFLHLGQYYENFLKDKSKAVRCYQRAFDLDNENKEAGILLIDNLRANGDEDKALGILNRVTANSNAGGAKWAWLRLGLNQLKTNNPTGAIISLQSALRADPNDFHCWECLGEAYMARGSYTASLKAFKRATELDDSSLFCFYQMASIKQILGMYDEAVCEYKGILEKCAYVPALKGLGETYLQMAHAALKAFFDGRAVDYCQETLSCLTKAATQRPDLSCVWKLLGDACTIIAPLPSSKAQLLMPAKLISQADTHSEFIQLTKKETLAVGAKCYGMALKLMPDSASLWHDLGVNYYHQSKMADKTKQKQLIRNAVQSLQNAVQLDPDNPRHWNVLGVISTHDLINHPGLAQHCFIKSIEADANNVTAWTNLGVLYLVKEEVKLAHEAFKVAQSLEPSYVTCWIGQALIAEIVGDDEAMDLFRHTTELGNHLEASIGYAHWVCNVLMDTKYASNAIITYAIEQMAAVPAASDALSKFVERIPDDPVAGNLYGLLLERQKLYSMACKVFKNALAYCKSNEKLLSIIQINYARVLCISKWSSAGVEQYQLLSGTNDFDILCGYGLALYEEKRYEESFDIYQNALAHPDAVADLSSIHTAMGMAAYALGDKAKVKSCLFAASQQENPSTIGLQALLCLGLVEKDYTLCTAVLGELARLGLLGNDFLLEALAAEVRLLAHMKAEACRQLQRAIFLNPSSSTLWAHLAHFLLRPENNRSSLACQILTKVGLLHEKKEDILVRQAFARNHLLMKGFSCLGAGHHGRNDRSSNAYNVVQKAIHSNPLCMDNWFLLLGAVYAEQQIQPTVRRQVLLLSLTTRVMGQIESELSQSTNRKERLQRLHVSCVKYYIMCLLQAGRLDQAQQFLQQAVWLYETDIHLQALTCAFNQDFAGLKQISLRDLSGFGSHLLALLYSQHGLCEEAENTYQIAMNATSNPITKAGFAANRAFFALKLINNCKTLSRDDMHKWLSIFRESCKIGSKAIEKNKIFLLLQGLQMAPDPKSLKSAKSSLHKFVESFRLSDLSDGLRLAVNCLLPLLTDQNDADLISHLQIIAKELNLN